MASLRARLVLLAVPALGLLQAGAPTGQAAATADFHEGAQIVRQVFVKARPAAASRRVGYLPTYTPYTGRRLVVPVLARRTDADGHEWIRVALHSRPNGSSGWIPRWITRSRRLEWRIEVSLRRRTVTVIRTGRRIWSRKAVVGRSDRPTPRGRFYVVDRVRMYRSWGRGVWALPLSAHSTAVRRFDGGDGRVAIHGRGRLADPLGSARSNGCIRLSDSATAWLAKRVPVGTPVVVR